MSIKNKLIEWSKKEIICVEFRNNKFHNHNFGLLSTNNKFVHEKGNNGELSEYNENLEFEIDDFKNMDKDIVKIYNINVLQSLEHTNHMTLLWKREEIKEHTMKELQQKLGYEFKLVKEK